MTSEDHDKIEELAMHFISKAGRYWHTSDVQKLADRLELDIRNRMVIVNLRTDHLEEN